MNMTEVQQSACCCKKTCLTLTLPFPNLTIFFFLSSPVPNVGLNSQLQDPESHVLLTDPARCP